MSPDPSGLTLAETDRRVARYVWLERRRFQALGTWAASAPEAEVRSLFAVQAHHHAWHASMWAEHLPRRSGSPPDHLADATVDLSAWAQAVEAPGGDQATLLRLVGAYRVTAARAVVAYTDHLSRASPVSDAALMRTCRLVLGDQLTDWRDGEQLLQRQLLGEEDIDRAAGHQAHLEKLLLAAGGIAGSPGH